MALLLTLTLVFYIIASVIVKKGGGLEKASHGVYTLPEVWEDEFVNVQRRFKRDKKPVPGLPVFLYAHNIVLIR